MQGFRPSRVAAPLAAPSGSIAYLPTHPGTAMNHPTKRLHRSPNSRMVAGVLGGVAEYFNVDPTIVRVVYAAAAVVSAGFPGIILYCVAWAIIPESPS